MTSGIYRIINKTTDKVYVGQSSHIRTRINSHFRNLKRGSHNCLEMQSDFNGGHCFDWELIEEVPLEALDEREQYWIKFYRQESSVYNVIFLEPGNAIGFYFREVDKQQVNAIRAELNRIAKELGYLAKTGPTMGRGNAAALLVAIAKGEVKLTKP